MDIPLDEVIHVEAISSGATGVAVDADSTPTFAVYEESTDTDIGVGGNMTKRTSLDGNYRASFTASAANGFEVGKFYTVIGSATIGGVATKGVLKAFRVSAAEVTVGKFPATVAAGDLPTNLSKAVDCIGYGIVTTGASTTSIPTSAMTPSGAIADQFKGRVLTFSNSTTTVELRGVATDITASSNSATPTFTVTALPATPVSGDTFVIT